MTDLDADAIELDPGPALALYHEGAATLVDVRTDEEHAVSSVPGALHIPLDELSARAAEVPSDRPVIFYCRVGGRSMMAAQAFRASGVQAHSMAGGLIAFAAEGRALDPPGARVADH